MGANQSVDLLVGQKFEETSFNLRNDTHLVREMNNDFYGESQLMQYKESLSHPYLVLKSRLIASKTEYEEFIKEPQKRKNLRSPYVLPLLNIYQVKQQDYCSKYYKIYMLFAYCEKTLFDAMIEYNEQQQTFTEQDIIQMIENVLQGILYLKENGISHDMIKASTISISTPAAQNNSSGIAEYLSNSSKKVNTAQSQSKQNNTKQELLYGSVFNNPNVKYIIADSKFMHNGKDSYTQALLGDTQDFYLSPQLFSRLKHRFIQGFSISNLEEQHSSDVSQVFSLGMVAVEMATLKSVRKIYDFDYFCLNKGRLMNKLEIISELYSPQLAFIIAKMLTFNEKDRPTLSQTLNLIQNYQENPQQFLDINFTPQMILENYNNTEGDAKEQSSQQVIKTLEDEEGEQIKRVHKEQNYNQQPALNESKELYTFKQPTTGEGHSDIGNNIHIITNSSNKNEEFNKNRSKSPSTVQVKEYPIKEFATPNKFNNDFTPAQSSSSQHLRGMSTALHNQHSLSSQKNNNFPQHHISDYNQNAQPYQNHPVSESQICFHRDEVHNGPYSNSYLQNSAAKSGGRSSQQGHSQKPSNQSSRVPSQKLLHYDQPDFKLEKDYENPNQSQLDYSNTANYNKQKPTDQIDKKKYSHSYSQSLISSSINNTIKAQGNPYTSQSQKIEPNGQSQLDYLRMSNPDQIRQSNLPHHQHSKTLSDIMTESHNVQISKKFPHNNQNNQFNQTTTGPMNSKYIQSYDNNFIKRSLTPDFTKIDFDQINKSIKMNAPNAQISPKYNNQKGQVYQHPQPSNKSNRSESLIGSNQQVPSPMIDSSQNNNQKYSLKFSPKNVGNQLKESPNFFKNSNSSSGVKRAGPPSKSVHVTSSQGLLNSNLLQSDQNNRYIQPNNQPQNNVANSNQLQIPTQGQYYYRHPSNQNSHNSSLQRNDDSISVQVPNETDANNMEYPQQRIYNFDVKTISDTKDRQLFSPQQSQYLQNSKDIQQYPQEMYDNNNYPNNQSYSQKNIQPDQNILLKYPNGSNIIRDSGNPNYNQSVGQSNNPNNKQTANNYNYHPPQQQNQSYYPNQSQKFQNNQDYPSQSLRNQNSIYNNPQFIQSASSLAIAHNLIGSNQIDHSNSVKEQLFTQPPNQNIYQLIQQKQPDRTNNFSKTDPIDIKSIIKEKDTNNYLDNSLINQNLTINGPPTPRNSIRGSKNMYHLYEKSPNKDDLKYKLEKVTIPEEEYNKNIQQTITELEQKIKDFDSRISKQKLGNSQIGSSEMHLKSQEEQQSSFKKFLNSFSCKSNNNVVQDQQNNPNVPQQRTPLKNLFTDDRISPERFPIVEENNFNNNHQQRASPNPYSNSRQNSHFNGSMNQRQNIHSSKSPVQNSRDMKAFFQNTTPFSENQY